MLVVVDPDAALQHDVARLGEAEGLAVIVCATARAAYNACRALANERLPKTSKTTS